MLLKNNPPKLPNVSKKHKILYFILRHWLNNNSEPKIGIKYFLFRTNVPIVFIS
jgi:hypothetical protein